MNKTNISKIATLLCTFSLAFGVVSSAIAQPENGNDETHQTPKKSNMMIAAKAMLECTKVAASFGTSILIGAILGNVTGNLDKETGYILFLSWLVFGFARHLAVDAISQAVYPHNADAQYQLQNCARAADWLTYLLIRVS